MEWLISTLLVLYFIWNFYCFKEVLEDYRYYKLDNFKRMSKKRKAIFITTLINCTLIAITLFCFAVGLVKMWLFG